jgi:HEAT repeat protein
MNRKRILIVLLAVALSGCTSKPEPILIGGKPVSDWVRTLSDPDPNLRRKAAEKLGIAGARDPQAVAALCGALQDKNAVVRREAILALAKLGPAAQEALEPLKTIARQDRDPQVRSYAAKALEKIAPGDGK